MNPLNDNEWLIVASHGWLECPVCGANASLRIDECHRTGAVTFTQTCERYPHSHFDVIEAVKPRRCWHIDGTIVRHGGCGW